MGPHCGYTPTQIFERKMNDIQSLGFTFWSMKSRMAQPDLVQSLSKKNGGTAYVILIQPATPGGAKDTTIPNYAQQFSPDNRHWYQFDKRLCKVMVNIRRDAFAFRFDKITLIENKHIVLDLWNYASYLETNKAIRTGQGFSTVCAEKKDTRYYPDRMLSHEREIVAVARLIEPYCVWLR